MVPGKEVSQRLTGWCGGGILDLRGMFGNVTRRRPSNRFFDSFTELLYPYLAMDMGRFRAGLESKTNEGILLANPEESEVYPLSDLLGEPENPEERHRPRNVARFANSIRGFLLLL